ncbi:carbohydrate ABC transporter permease [Bacillus sp. AFS002410]|uniref:carbohydrate ABC transporter permease n=1 Tax=Bacillus sp. AFS002410 TaxID=2033481 RepID=UPI00211D78A6|nr:carbohydrate ABC transporter permease [Bacillus sp. AFS002410]
MSQRLKKDIAPKVRRILLGMQGNDGLLVKILMYALLIGIGFVFLYPILYMLSYSFKDINDLLNSLVNWIPTKLYTDNYKRALDVLDYWPILLQTIYVTVLPSILQAFVASIIGYGFARFQFKGKNILFILVLATFVIPPQVTVIPRYILFNKIHILDSISAYVLPAIFGQGLNSAIFILIFYQIFRSIPTSLEEAAQLDGAGHFKIFFKIAVPMASAGYIISFLFSLVWYWNETYLASIYFGENLSTLPLQLQKFVATYSKLFPAQGGASGTSINEGIELAGTLLTIIPLLVIYFITQRWFVESVDRSGITGE